MQAREMAAYIILIEGRFVVAAVWGAHTETQRVTFFDTIRMPYERVPGDEDAQFRWLCILSGVVPARCDTGSPWTFLPPLPGAGYPTRNWQIVLSRVISGISSGCVGASRVWLGQRNGTPIDAIGQLYFLTFTRDFKALRLS